MYFLPLKTFSVVAGEHRAAEAGSRMSTDKGQASAGRNPDNGTKTQGNHRDSNKGSGLELMREMKTGEAHKEQVKTIKKSENTRRQEVTGTRKKASPFLYLVMSEEQINSCEAFKSRTRRGNNPKNNSTSQSLVKQLREQKQIVTYSNAFFHSKKVFCFHACLPARHRLPPKLCWHIVTILGCWSQLLYIQAASPGVPNPRAGPLLRITR